jgi:hypothetical protein
MNRAQIQDAIDRLSVSHATLTAGSDTLLWCKQHDIYAVLESLREKGRNDKAVRMVAERLALIFRYRGTRVFLERLASIIHELKGMQA